MQSGFATQGRGEGRGAWLRCPPVRMAVLRLAHAAGAFTLWPRLLGHFRASLQASRGVSLTRSSWLLQSARPLDKLLCDLTKTFTCNSLLFEV